MSQVGFRHAGVRWGIVGCGDVTEVKSGPALFRIDGSELVAVMRRDPAKVQDYAARHNVPTWTTNARELIEHRDVNAVYVATPPSSHAEYVHMAAAAGKPVYVEKPMAMTILECEGMVHACERAGVALFVAYYRRALPRFEFVRELLNGGAVGEVGEPQLVQSTLFQPVPADPGFSGWRWDPTVSAGGLFMDLGSHMLDLFDHWFGPIRDVCGWARTRLEGVQAEDTVTASYAFSSGVLGSGAWGFAGSAQQDRTMIVCRHGTISLPIFAEGSVDVTDAKGRTTRKDIPHPAHVQEPLLRTVVNELLGRGGRCPSTGVSAARTQGVLDEVLAEHRRGRLGRKGATG